MSTHPAVRAFYEAAVTMLAALATLACALSIDAEPGAAVLSVVLCVSFARSHLDRDWRGRLEAAIALPLVGLIATGVGALLLHEPWLGAAVFVIGMFVSIWLRRFGAAARRIGSLIALPFVVILTTPYIPTRHASHALALVMPMIVGLLALCWVALFQWLARWIQLLPPLRPTPRTSPALPTGGISTMRPMPSTRMAVQMAVALSLSFVVGYVFFAEHWAWIVLTAFIVNIGNRGRLDVAYKSVLRVAGAGAGTLIALTLALHNGSHGTQTIAWMLAAIFFGMWLRSFGYAWWALFVTIALALLQVFEGASSANVLWPRLQEIMLGAVIGVVSAWAVFPVRSTDVLRRRVANALALLSDAIDPTTPARSTDEWNAALAEVAQVVPAFRAIRRVTGRFRAPQPADWADDLLACREPALPLIHLGEAPASVRKAVGAARKALREPAALLAALRALRQQLTGLN